MQRSGAEEGQKSMEPSFFKEEEKKHLVANKDNDVIMNGRNNNRSNRDKHWRGKKMK